MPDVAGAAAAADLKKLVYTIALTEKIFFLPK